MKCSKCGTDYENLAVLADRKGFWKVFITRSADCMAMTTWTFEIQRTTFNVRVDKQRNEVFCDSTYSNAESACREYLNGLPDRGGKGK
jgi:hypothetical protein